MEEEKKVVDIQAPAEQAAPESQEELLVPAQEAPEVGEGKKGKKKKGKAKEQSKKKRVLNAIFLTLQILLIVAAITICLIVILNPAEEDKVSPLGIKLLPVRSNSMAGDNDDSFSKGALVIAKKPKNGGRTLEVGDIVTFKDRTAEGESILNTHRIIEVNKITQADGTDYITYKTKGDNNPMADSVLKTPSDILAVYSFHINHLGSAILWIRDGYHFIFVVIIPLGLLFLYNIYLVAQIIVESKMRKAKALAAEKAKEAALASIDEEEIKRRAIEEYLRSQAMTAEQAAPQDKGDTE